jgi:heptosyltransferase-3
LNDIKNILVYRIGSLGDNLVAVPAIRAAKKYFPQARFSLLSDYQVGLNRVQGRDIFLGSGIFDDFLSYPFDPSRWGKWFLPFRLLRLALALRRKKFDALIYLPPMGRPPSLVRRDRRFFRLAGIGEIYGADLFAQFPVKVPGTPLPPISHESDFMLARLKASGIAVPPEGQGDMDLNLGEKEQEELQELLDRLPPDGGRPWIGVGPGSKQPAKLWPVERFQEVVGRLIREKGVWPVVFGGPEDQEIGKKLLAAWGCGYNFAGLLGVRPVASAFERCRLYLGNDTGTMHLAAAAKTPCVAVFCSHAYPGQWYPYGPGHQVFRTSIDCEACRLVACVERKMECILSIGVDEVAEACAKTLDRPWNGVEKNHE